ncbi:MAG: class I SAM-dependent methyltransferase [Planctomycetes bacterium]|nr:class I SAM-dependent methyltransferase [Planctomycetota bacterium]
MGTTVHDEAKVLDHLREAKAILDVGCGKGFFLRAAGPERTWGIDISGASIAECLKAGLRALHCDAGRIGDPAVRERILSWAGVERFDAVHFSHLIEYFTPDQAYEMLGGMRDLLIPRGILVVKAPLVGRTFWDTFGHVKPYNEVALEGILCGVPGAQLERETLGFERLAIHFRWTGLAGKLADLGLPVPWRWKRASARAFTIVARKLD